MIRGSAVIECGTGSVESISACTEDGVGVVFMRSGPPRKMGVTSDNGWRGENAEVIIYFNNVESLDVVIDTYQSLRADMVKQRGDNPDV